VKKNKVKDINSIFENTLTLDSNEEICEIDNIKVVILRRLPSLIERNKEMYQDYY